jgi:hypothetical protein
MINDNGYIVEELIGRKAFEQLMAKYRPDSKLKIRYTDARFSPYDAAWDYVTNDGKKRTVLVEIKVRHDTYSNYILEHKKFLGMDKIAFATKQFRKDVTLLYVNFCPEATYIWDISKANEKHTLASMWATVKNQRTNRYEDVEKQVYNLPTSEAHKYKFIIDKQAIREELRNDPTHDSHTF